MNKSKLGNRIRKSRKSCGLTADKLAEILNINPTFLRQIEGGRSLPSLPVFVSICNALKVSPDYLLADSIEENEFSLCEELFHLWSDSDPRQAALIADMIITANKHMN